MDSWKLMTPPTASVAAHADTPPTEFNVLFPPSRIAKNGRSMSAASIQPDGRLRPFGSGPTPGSFAADLEWTSARNRAPRNIPLSRTSFEEDDVRTSSEQRQAEIREKIEKETKIKIGSENLLEALNLKSAKQAKEQKLKVEAELHTSNRKLAELKFGLEEEIRRSRDPPVAASSGRLSNLFRSAPPRSPSRQLGAGDESLTAADTESPSFVLAEILQALESEGRPPDYYVQRANSLVELFKRHPTLKYDLAWSIFGLRVQMMLLSSSREVIAAGYRVMRYAITDRTSLQIIRGLNTDYMVIMSLVKETKATLEREQALKFVRAFMDVRDGVKELSLAVLRIIVAVAENNDDRLRSICLLTVAEILIRDPPLLVAAGGMGTLTDALGDGSYHAAESLAAAFMHMLDLPKRRRFLRSGHELEAPFAAFTDSPSNPHLQEEKLKTNAKVIAALFKSWPGVITLSMNDFFAVRSLISSLLIPSPQVRNILLELLFDILRIKPPSWSSSFLAGRRLTTYGRVTNLKSEGPNNPQVADKDGDTEKQDLLEHFTAVVLAVLLHSGLVKSLLYVAEDVLSMPLKRKTTLLLGEVLRMANQLLPSSWGAAIQVLPGLFDSAAAFNHEDRSIASGTIYQVDSVNRTLYRSGPAQHAHAATRGAIGLDSDPSGRQAEQAKTQSTHQMDEAQFRTLMLETQVLNTVNYTKWRWDLIQSIIEGPLLNPKRLDEALKATKFLHRLLGFYRPFKYRFSDVKNTKPNQRYVRAGCALLRTLLQNPEGARYVAESKLIRQLAECLSHFDRMSGLTSASPLLSFERMSETLTGGYFALLGALSGDSRGMQILERWRIVNMFYHIVELSGRDDMIKALLSNMDYTQDGHLRVIISKAMTACSKDIRIFATRLLRKYATRPIQSPGSSNASAGLAEWAIRLLITQLYDPEIEVCEVAVRILEEACNRTQSLEYVVKCRPALDHLGAIGAPLMLRFLSTSVGYHYLDGVDYISKEMDDWFLGRNDTYVVRVEASLMRAFTDFPERQQQSHEEAPEPRDYGTVPPHFYRELTRTEEGCKLLEQKGHFDEFVATIRDCGMEDEDAEIILKVKGCLWAVGNVGSMELGAPFLDRTNVVKWMVHVAENSAVMTLRGTACFALGLVSRSIHGQEILTEYGWDGSVDGMGRSLGYCMPLEFKKLFSVSDVVFLGCIRAQ